MTDLLKPFGIVELQRTGRIALPKLARQPGQAACRQDRAPSDRLSRSARDPITEETPMPATIYYDDDADLGLLDGTKVAVLGYGSQGHAHALNLKDSGVDVRVGLREGSSSRAKAEEAGLRVLTTAEAVQGGRRRSWCCCPTPSRSRSTRPTSSRNLDDGNSLAFAHGFNIHFDQITPPEGRRRVDDRAEGPRPPRAPHLRGGRRRAVRSSRSTHDATGKAKQTALAYAQGDRRHARRRARHHVRGGDRDRPLRRAGRALRRARRADPQRLRDARRSRATSPSRRTSRRCTR